MSCRDFINVTLAIDDHKFHAHQIILAVSIDAAFPQGEASPHSTGSSRGVTSLGSGHWRQIEMQKFSAYQFSHDDSFEFFDHIISEMIDALSKSLVFHILYCVYKN